MKHGDGFCTICGGKAKSIKGYFCAPCWSTYLRGRNEDRRNRAEEEKEEMIKETMKITGLSREDIEEYNFSYTHSEMRKWVKINGIIQPKDFIVLDKYFTNN